MSQELKTIIVLRNDSSTNWADSEVVLEKGETGIAYLDNGNVMVKAGDGEHKWSELPQVEGVFEKNQILTYSFGKHKIETGKTTVDAGGKDMTVSQWLIDSLKETVEPTVTHPNVTLSASCPNSGASLEIGSYINSISYAHTPSVGKYTVSGVDQASGITTSNFTYSVSNSVDTQTATKEDGSFDITNNKKQINTTSKASYGRVDSTVTINVANAKDPINNLGEVSDKVSKITGFSDGTTTKTLSAEVYATGYRNTWTYVGTDHTTAINSAFIRGCTALNKNTTSIGTLNIPEGTTRVMVAIPGTHSLTSVIDVLGQGLDVKDNFTTETIDVEGANGFTAASYTVFHFENENGIKLTKYTFTIA